MASSLYNSHVSIWGGVARESSQVSTWKNIRTGARKCPPVGVVSSPLYLKFIPRYRISPVGYEWRKSRKMGCYSYVQPSRRRPLPRDLHRLSAILILKVALLRLEDVLGRLQIIVYFSLAAVSGHYGTSRRIGTLFLRGWAWKKTKCNRVVSESAGRREFGAGSRV